MESYTQSVVAYQANVVGLDKKKTTQRLSFYGRGYRNRTYTKGVRGPCATTTPIPSDEEIIIHLGSNDKSQRVYVKKILKM